MQRDRRQAQADDFPEQLGELLGYLYDRLPENHPFAPLARTLPGRPECPELWLLGSSPQSGIWAAELGLPYMFADFISPHGGLDRQRYRERIRPASEETRRAIDGRGGLGASAPRRDEEAWRLSASIRMAILLLQAGRLIAVPTPEKALGFLSRRVGSPDAKARNRRLIAGSPATVRAGDRGGGAGIRRRGGDDRHHHPRPSGAPALL